jgi:uncharacterized membrane protein
MRVQLALWIEFLLIALGGGILLALLALEVRGTAALLSAVRVLLGLVYVLLVPGYLLQCLLFPRGDHLDALERFAFSLGLSIALIPPLAFILDYAEVGINLRSIAISGTLYCGLVGLLAWYQRRRVPPAQRFHWSLEADPVGWWASQPPLVRMLYRALGALLAVIVIAGVAILVLPRPATLFTEFYMLGEQGQADTFPIEITVGEEANVIIGITNREGRFIRYRVEARQGDQVIGDKSGFDLESGQNIERRLTFTPTRIGAEIEIVFLLFRDDETQPYRSLRLWMKVNSAA